MSEGKMSADLEKRLREGFGSGTPLSHGEQLRAEAADHIATLQREAEEAAGAFDANVLRLKACECIAEGEEGWQTVRDACPSAAAVATLRDQFEALQREADGMREALVKVAHAMDTLIHEGVDRGKGHWPAWDDCARAVDAARAALNGPPQDDGAKGSDL